MSRQNIKINGHGHLLPYPDEIPKFMREREIFWVTDDQKFMCQGKWRRPVSDPSFFLSQKLEWMDKHQIDKEVILNLSQLYCNGYDRQTSLDVIRFQNDYNARIQSENQDKFVSGFVVQPVHLDDALKEIERCVEHYDLPLLCLPTHFLDSHQKWISIADESILPIFELADEYKLAIEIHPYNAEEIIQLEDKMWRFHLIWMCAQTADAYHFYTLLDFPDRFQNIRTCFAHGNQFGQVGLGRRVQGFNGRPDLFPGAKNPMANNRHSKIYFDSLVHDVLSFELLIKRQGSAQVIAGLDDPYPLGEMDYVLDSYPGKVIDLAVENEIISMDEKNQIWHQNVLRWLYGDRDLK